jgi:hypothetical protein
MISLLSEDNFSADATEHTFYAKLGLADAAIGVARIHHCTVMTDDLDLNFTHLRAQQWRL